jgi:IS605 OrfB family transposase
MADKKDPVTQRAYTLRLRPTDKHDRDWREALWQTHEAVNKGAKAFGDWLLTLRGGLDHTLANAQIECGKEKPPRNPTDAEAKARRILLALSWVSVESKLGAPEKFIIASPQDAAEDRNRKVLAALEEILATRGVQQNEINAWKNDCSASLSAAIRDDAVWVNRSKAFDEACDGQNKQQGREDARIVLWYLLTEDYLTFPTKKAEKNPSGPSDQEEEEPDSGEGGDAVAKSGKGAGQRTRHLFSHIFGKEKTEGFGEKKHTLTLRSHWKNHLKPLVEAAGIPLGDPNTKADKDESLSPTEFHREMFSKAAARLAQIWTKQKQQEAERERRTAADHELGNLEKDPAYDTALKLLDTLCSERGQSTGSLEEYQINPRAIAGWDRIVAAWEKITETDANQATEKRIEEAKRLEGENPDKKFGDINLFVSLAESKYEPVWWHNGQAMPSILKTYVTGWKARMDAVRLKVAAFRHPDPCFHPVFCQFGVSRPQIVYSRLKENRKDDPRKVEMRLLSGNRATDRTLLAVSKRFDKEIGSISIEIPASGTSRSVLEVSRRSRMGIAAVAGLNGSAVCRVAHVFDEQEVKSRKRGDDDRANNEARGRKHKKPSWNGTLQADRRELEAIGRMESSRPEKAREAKQRLRWWLTVSLELQRKGPWYDFIKNSSDKTAFTRIYKSGKNKGNEYVSQDGWPHERADYTSKGHAPLILSRLPGLRVLSVDLGHRYAAACAVWETLSREAVHQACEQARCPQPTESNLYIHLKRKVPKQRNGKEVVVEETTVFRRIGPDKLSGDTPHPAPWARLDRQFLIKLQGEEEGVREASNEEIWAVHRMEAEVCRSVPLIDRLIVAGWGQSDKQRKRLDALRKLGWKAAGGAEVSGGTDEDEGEVRKPSLSVDELMFSAVRTMRLALKRHGERARIAFAMTAAYKPMPGYRKYYFTEAKELSANDDPITRTNKHIEFIRDALVLWDGLACSRGWRDDAAKQLWDDHIAKLSGYKAPEEIGEDASGVERKKKQKENRERLHDDVAKALAEDATLRETLHTAWKTRWEYDDERWKKHLRWFKDWILPRGKAANDLAIQKVGGLSLTRLATLTEFRRKVQVGFFTRLRPDGTTAEISEKFGEATIEALDRLREQRVRQLASRIAEAALGIGSENPLHWEAGRRRPTRRIPDPRFAPCHAVVIENLTHYRPDQTRTRRENRQLMTWSSSKVKKYLTEECELYGLYLCEVPANYTSRQDSRTGAPGVRCVDVPVAVFMNSVWWRKARMSAHKRDEAGKATARDQLLLKLEQQWQSKTPEELWAAGTLRLIQPGGEIFVSSDLRSPAAKGLHADLNAAANIGLRALTDPEWPGKYWYVPCDAHTFKPVAERLRGCTAIDLKKPLRNPPAVEVAGAQKTTRGRKPRMAGKSGQVVVNLWRDISASSIKQPCDNWQEHAAYWGEVEKKVAENIDRARPARQSKTSDDGEDQIPF